jgi:hypothetical protein
MGAITDLWKSERGLVTCLLLVCATVLVALGQMTVDQWVDFSKWIAVVYVGGKTVTSAVETMTAAKAAPAPPAESGTTTASAAPAPAAPGTTTSST